MRAHRPRGVVPGGPAGPGIRIGSGVGGGWVPALTARVSIRCLVLGVLGVLTLVRAVAVPAQAAEDAGPGAQRPPAPTLRERVRERIRERLRARRSGGNGAARRDRATGEVPGPGPRHVELAGRDVLVWEPTTGTPGPQPVVIFSHGFHGTPGQSSFLARALAHRGFWVLAPAHADALGGAGASPGRPGTGFGRPDDWTEDDFRDRARDVEAVVAVLRTDRTWRDRIDLDRIALAGHSLGGYTVVGLAGAWPGWRLPGVRAVLALSPYVAPFLRHGTLGSLQVPVMYQTGTRDLGVAPTLIRRGGAFEATPSPAVLVVFEGAGHFAWTDLVPDHQDSITGYALDFLERHLGSGDREAPYRRRPDVSDLKSR